MRLPFSDAQFLDLFADYNTTFWPVLILLWVAMLVALVQFIRGRAGSAALSGFAALLWAWTAVAYHALFFTRINPAAWMFAALFLAQALGFLWLGVRTTRLSFVRRASPRHVVGAGLMVYALVYPALVWIAGLDLPRAPAAAVPCPVTIFTAGLLLAAAQPVPRVILIAPIAWSLIGGSAAVLFGVTPDLMLFVAGLGLAALALPASARRRLSHPGASEQDLARVMAGDALVPAPNYLSTLGIDVAARPEQIWPWLVQMGYRRGGLYSYDWLDQLFGYLDRPSANELLPEFQTLRPGDVIPMGRGAGFPVHSVDPNRLLTLGGVESGFQWIWEIGLYPIDDRRTRLVSRNRARVPATLVWKVSIVVLAIAAFIMTRRMLIGLKQRAEKLAPRAAVRTAA